MKESGWYFIALGALVIAGLTWWGIKQFKKPNRKAGDYHQRMSVKLNTVMKLSLDFGERLRLKYGNLTDHDLKVAQMLVSGLSSKEIAFQLNISPSSVNTARYRLRKRMLLSPDTDLVAALHQV